MKYLTPLCCLLLLWGCTDTAQHAPDGNRLPAFQNQSPVIQQTTTDAPKLSAPVVVTDWLQHHYTADNAVPTLKLSAHPTYVKRISGGSGLDNNTYALAKPVIFKNTIYTIDGQSRLQAYNLTTGKVLFKKRLPVSDTSSVQAVGLAIDAKTGHIFVAMGSGNIFALKDDGAVVWHQSLGTIIRSSITLYQNHLYIISAANTLTVLNADTGIESWSYRALPASASFLGMPQPAVSNNTVVTAFSSGEIMAFNAKSGTLLWSDMLLPKRSFSGIGDLTHIAASPIIDGQTVYVFSAAGKMGAYDLKTGRPVLTAETGAVQTPIISGNTLFVLTNDKALTALNKKTGALFWKTQLPDSDTADFWLAPVLINTSVAVPLSNGDIHFFDALTGNHQNILQSDELLVSPISSQETLFVWTKESDLYVFK